MQPTTVRNALFGLLFLATSVLAMVIAAALAGPPAPAAAQGACPQPSQSADSDDPRIVVSSPQAGAQVTSPVTVEGEAAVFEANVSITIFDAQGNVLVETFATALDAGPTMAPFSTQVEFSVSADEEGCIWVFEASAADGSPQEVVAIPVTLLASVEGEFSLEPTPAGVTIATYTGSMAQFEAGGTALDLVSCFATVQGAFVGYVFGAPAFANAQFVTQFAAGLNERGLICRRA